MQKMSVAIIDLRSMLGKLRLYNGCFYTKLTVQLLQVLIVLL